MLECTRSISVKFYRQGHCLYISSIISLVIEGSFYILPDDILSYEYTKLNNSCEFAFKG